MSLRTCNCRGHSSRAALVPNNCAGSAGETAYVPPTRALMLQLSRFPLAQLHRLQACAAHPGQDVDGTIAVQSRYPHLAVWMQRSASMRLHWAPPQPQPSAQSAATPATSSPFTPSADEVERSSGVALRLLGLSSTEHAASQQRAQLLAAARVRSGVDASPAASYPPAFGAPGAVRMEIASNHLPLHLLATARRTALLAEADPERRALGSHCGEPVFLTPQGMDACDTGAPLEPFLPQPAALLQRHSSVPLVDRAQRGVYIQRIVRHVAHRLSLSCAGSVPSTHAASAASSATPPANVLLLHLDAQSLLGLPPADTAGAAEHVHAALSFLDQLLAALMTQLQPLASSFTSPTSSSPFPQQQQAQPSAGATGAAAAHGVFPASHSQSSLAPSAPLQAASQLLSSRRLCPDLMWCLVIDDDDAEQQQQQQQQAQRAQQPADVDPCAALRAQVLQSIRPVQSYRVQDGCVTAPSTTWLTCSAFMYHYETTRMAAGVGAGPATASNAAVTSPAPLHGSLHLTHLLKELLFKLGLSSKYGA